jgi:hypothetical protein
VKAAVAILVIAALALLVLVAAVSLVQRRLRARAPWALREESDGDALRVLAVKPGAQPLLVASVPFGGDDFDSRLYEARSEGRDKVRALNSP